MGKVGIGWVGGRRERKWGVPLVFFILVSQALPWLELAALHNEEAERKERVKRLQLQKDAKEGIGFGPAPKTVAKPYVSAYAKSGSISGTYKCSDR